MKNDDLPERGSAASNYYYSRPYETNHIGNWFDSDGPESEQAAQELEEAFAKMGPPGAFHVTVGEYSCERTKPREDDYGNVWQSYAVVKGPRRALVLTKRKEGQFKERLAHIRAIGSYRKVRRGAVLKGLFDK